MFSFKIFTRTHEDVMRIAELEAALNEANSKALCAQAELAKKTEALESITNAVRSQRTIINWKAINAFSVERIALENEVYTVIGFAVPTVNADGSRTSRVEEWNIYCSDAQHEELCEQFYSFIAQYK